MNRIDDIAKHKVLKNNSTKITKSEERREGGSKEIAYVDSALDSLRSCVIATRSLTCSSLTDPLCNTRTGQDKIT